MKILESGEMYLETILLLSKKSPYVRSLDIAEEMNYSKPSVSRAVNILKDNDYIAIDKNGHITLLEKGLKTATKIYERHVVVTECLIKLGVSKKQAETDACKIEHVLSDESFNAIKNHLNNVKASN